MDVGTQTKLNDFLTANLGDKPFTFNYDDKRQVCRISMPELGGPDYFTFYRWLDRAFPEIRMEFVRPILAKEDNEILVDKGTVDLEQVIAEQLEAKTKLEQNLATLQLRADSVKQLKGA